MEIGFLYHDYHRTAWLREPPQHIWQGDFSDHMGPKPRTGLVTYAGARCGECRMVLFEYLAE